MFINEPHFLTQAWRINPRKEDYANRQKGHPALHGGVAQGGGRAKSFRWQDILLGVQQWPWQPPFQQLSRPWQNNVEEHFSLWLQKLVFEHKTTTEKSKKVSSLNRLKRFLGQNILDGEWTVKRIKSWPRRIVSNWSVHIVITAGEGRALMKPSFKASFQRRIASWK